MQYKPIPSKYTIQEINDAAQNELAKRRERSAAQEKWLYGGTRASAVRREPKKKGSLPSFVKRYMDNV